MKIGLKTSETGVFLVNYGGDIGFQFITAKIAVNILLARKDQKSVISADQQI